MFMGINQVAYELLVENPMTGYMHEVIFSRILGHDEIEQGQYWQDSTQCWVCQKWNKIVINYHLHDDKVVFRQKIHQIENLHLTISRCVKEKYDEHRYGKKTKTPELEMEVVKVAEDRGPGFLTGPNTTNSSFNSDL